MQKNHTKSITGGHLATNSGQNGEKSKLLLESSHQNKKWMDHIKDEFACKRITLHLYVVAPMATSSGQNSQKQKLSIG